MNYAKSFAPANISCIFSIYRNKDAAKSGSTGLGFTVNEGVFVRVTKLGALKNETIKKPNGNNTKNKKENTIIFNNKKINFPAVSSVINKLNKDNEKVAVEIKTKLPLGCGFGISGASALATSYALNSLLNLKKTKKELARIAHIAEVENSTGLGDVVNQFYGGFNFREKPSCTFRRKKLSIGDKKIYYKVFGKIETKKVISNEKIKRAINRECKRALSAIKKMKKPKLADLIKVSKEFAISSGLLKSNKVKKTIKEIDKNNGNASMIMLGNSVFSDKKFKGSKMLTISERGARLL